MSDQEHEYFKNQCTCIDREIIMQFPKWSITEHRLIYCALCGKRFNESTERLSVEEVRQLENDIQKSKKGRNTMNKQTLEQATLIAQTLSERKEDLTRLQMVKGPLRTITIQALDSQRMIVPPERFDGEGFLNSLKNSIEEDIRDLESKFAAL